MIVEVRITCIVHVLNIITVLLKHCIVHVLNIVTVFVKALYRACLKYSYSFC